MSKKPTTLDKVSFVLVVACAACSSDGAGDGGGGTGGSTGSAGAGAGGRVGTGTQTLEGTCPDGFTPGEGVNTGFASDGTEREFHLLLPDDTTTPRPVFVSLTGTVQAELDFAAQSGLDQLPADGWIVVAPMRSCSQEQRNCNGFGSIGTNDGRIWEPWYDAQFEQSDDAGPDARFVEAAVRCVARDWDVDEDLVFVGGISAGGSFSNRLLTFESDFYAGGVPSSGNWYEGRAAPLSPTKMDPSLVVLVWGGPDDQWPPVDPFVDYDPETKQASTYYAAQEDVVTVSCSGTHGHIWPTAMTGWVAQTLLSHPKGTPTSEFELTSPPSGFSCVLGEYTDH